MYHYCIRMPCSQTSPYFPPSQLVVDSLSDPVASGELRSVEAASSTSTATSGSVCLALSCLTLTLLTLALLCLALTLTLLCLTLALSLLSLTLLSLTLLTVVLTIVTTVVGTAVVATVCRVVQSSGESSTNREPDAVILRATLSHRHDDRGVVGGRSQRTSTVDTIGKTSCKIRAQKSVAITSIVDALEESKGFGIDWVWVRLVAEVLDRYVRMTDDGSALQRLGSRIVRHVWVGEGSGDKVVDLDRELDGHTRADVLRVRG
jgi:membrane protein implicated in regulation of membrane protease activity